MTEKVKKIFSFRTVLLCGIAACLLCIIPFSKNLIVKLMETFVLHRELRDFQKWNDILVHSMTFFALIGVFWFFFQYVNKGKEIWKSLFKTASDAFKVENALKYLIAIAVIYFIAYSALIRANYEYADDIRRCYAGHKAWVGWSRYVSEILAVFLHTNFFINDISPITQLWTIVVLTITSFLLAYIVTEKQLTKLSVAVSTTAGLSIYFLANFSYKYDCPYMALSMLFGLLPFLFTEKKIDYIFASFISLILVCTSYQAANGIYIILAIFTAFKMWLKNKKVSEIAIFAGISVACYVVALVFFRFFLMNQFDSSLDSRGTEIATGIKALNMLKENYKLYAMYTVNLCGNTWIKALLILWTVLFPVTSIVNRGKRAIWSTIIMSLVVLFAMFSLTMGAYLVLSEALITNRTFLGFDIFIAILAIYSVSGLKNPLNVRRFIAVMAVCFVYGLIVEAVVYGNFIQKQKEYENFRFAILANDLSKIVDFDQPNSIYIGGVTGMPGKSRMERLNYPIGAGSVSPVLTKYIIKGYNMDFEFLSEYTLAELDTIPEVKKQLTDLPMIEDTFYHTIYGKGNQYYVYLKYPMINE